MRLDDARTEDTHLFVVAEHVEMVNAIAETILESTDFGGRRHREMERATTLVVVADRFHAHLGDGLGHRFGVGQPRFVLDFKNHAYAHFVVISGAGLCL
jgi:hypothetical protein